MPCHTTRAQCVFLQSPRTHWLSVVLVVAADDACKGENSDLSIQGAGARARPCCATRYFLPVARLCQTACRNLILKPTLRLLDCKDRR